MDRFTKEDLDKFLDELSKSRKESERKYIAYAGCRTYGIINIMEGTCDDPECKSCKAFSDSLKEVTKGWKKKDIK